ncbi:hypothetical protein [Thermospira aquatica]|uniref:DUF4468 domain-containing protein n=1 Tax=Thermospira aquatica TaxID=2828656 RepID=A0AAX3BB00_9SPIR|nr:hypothetical protein [Thermospira aquatica]URA09410.1 hypothetical protein KDW03_07900 [Thermospira aquatica]
MEMEVGIRVFLIIFMFVAFQNSLLGQDRYPKGEEVVAVRSYYIVYVFSEVDKVIGCISNYIREYEKREKVNIYGMVYPMRIEKLEYASDEYKWRGTDILRFRARYSFVYHYEVNNGWMNYQVAGRNYRNLFSAIFKRNEKKKEKVELIFRLYYFPWKSFFKYKRGELIKEEEDKWRSFSKFVNGFIEYMKKEGVKIIKVEEKE